jgi:tetratricopeptide (TPR) repeat protein
LLQGIAHVSQALALEPEYAAALELRGSLRQLLAAATPAASEASSHLGLAESDLRAAVDADPGRSSAWSLLGALLLTRGAFVDAHWAARRAYDADTHLRNPQEILGRLYRTAHEIGDDQEAEEWCRQMELRFPARDQCRLSQHAWSTTHEPGSISAATITGSWTTARSGADRQSDATQAGPAGDAAGTAIPEPAIAERLAPDSRRDPELLYRLASLRLGLGQRDQAIQALQDVITLRPRLAGMLRARRFADLRSDLRYLQ